MKKRIVAALLLACLAFVGCGKKEDENVVPADNNQVTTDESKPTDAQPADEVSDDNSTAATTDSSASNNDTASAEHVFDYDALGLKPVEYPKKFKLGDNLKNAIEILCYKQPGETKWDTSSVDTKDWQECFVEWFFQNSFCGIDFSKLYDKNYVMTKDQVEFAQYSLTGKYTEFTILANNQLQLGDASSGSVEGEIKDYTVDSEDGDTVTLTTKYTEITDKTSDNGVTNYDVKVTLKKNPYSVIDGYSIISIEKIKTK